MGRGTSKAGGAGGGGGGTAEQKLQAHFDKENARIEEFMNGKGNDSIEMENGQIIERYTMQYMKDYVLKEYKRDGEMPNDDSVSIRYNNGDIEVYGGGDDTTRMKLTGISGVIFNNEGTDAYAGRGIKIENYKELYPKQYPDAKGYEDDWRIDFT